MQYAQQFFEGLDGPASLTFLGLLFAAFLIGVLPAGLAYATRVREVKRRLIRYRAALETAEATAADLRDRLAAAERSVAGRDARLAEADDRLRRVTAERQSAALESTRLRDEVDQLRGSQLAAQIEAKENAEEAQLLRGRIDALSAQVQGLKQASRAQPTPAGAFDLNMVASLKAARTKAERLEERLRQVTADNETLRRQLS